MIYYFYSIIIGYIFGCINGSQIIGKIKNVDIKNSGVKNPGASNTAILLGWKYGIIVALIDIFKGVLAVALMFFILGNSNLFFSKEMNYFILYLTGASSVLGHNYPVTMHFKGGKGTATIIGLLFALDWKMALISVGLLIAFTLLTDYLVIGVLTMYLSFVFFTNYFGFGYGASLIALLLTLLSIYKHSENFKRISNKTEKRISEMFKKKKDV